MTREEAIQTIQEMCKRYIFMLDEDEAIDMAIEALTERNIARDIATILENEQDMRVMLQNAERPKSKWIKASDGDGWHDWYVFKCPLCGATIEDRQYRSWEYNFCPNCGARMGGNNNERFNNLL